jgi:acetyltransferase
MDTTFHSGTAARQAPRAGKSVVVRPIAPGDLDREREFIGGLSRATAYQRLMSARQPTDEEVERWTRPDPGREAALVALAESGGRELQVGVARYVVDERGEEAEFAIVLADAWQGQGLGRTLLSRLVEVARQCGVRRLVGTTLRENTAMLALARRLGFRASHAPGAAFIMMLSLNLS